MKKLSILFLLLIVSLSNIVADSFNEDCKYLENLFSEVAIDMSLALDNKALSSQSIIEEIKNVYKTTASTKKIKKDGIDNEAFSAAINKIYAKYSNTCGHVSIFNPANNDFFVPFDHQFIYYSDIYFIKENNSFRVYKDYKKIKKGMFYTGNIENLYKTIQDDEVVYRYGTLSSTFIKNCIVSIENKEIKIPVSGDVGIVKNNKDYEFTKRDTYIYLGIKKSNYSNKSDEKTFFEDSEKIINEFKNINTIIFDLRDNLGGFTQYLNHFAYGLVYDKKTKENDLEFSKWNRNLYAGEKRINTDTIIDKTLSIGLAPSDYIEYCKNNLGTKYLEEITYEKIELNPWYKGKIYILLNPLTSSAAENFTLNLKKIFGENVIIIGQNSNGSLEFADIYRYNLPNSKIRLTLCAVDARETILLKEECWHGDTKGIFPDYWCAPQDIITILFHFIKSDDLRTIIKL